ncbi:MAG: YihY/virulence factor BrkB family protein [Bacteroidetes bacterium]|nr:YihY/virulence factor BrkB family protein [Bacteroidota bacterium]MBL0019455.1 YihY/virulence factor BrkB family protein [Bacteroidota bacterium]MBP6640722.1 YihY/virulence factor BrkB family protein [Bacteroidia bacterium]MBP6722349.1 YihY/virulence factor BrkB family protein [Bacteroidia bacterium]
MLKNASKAWYDKDPFRESAVIAYYAIFSLPGLMVVIVTLAGYIFGKEVVSSHVADQIAASLGSDTAAQIQEMILKAGKKGTSFWATVLGIVTILIGATGVFAQFQHSLNLIWGVTASSSKSGLWKLLRVRLFSFGLIASITFILIVSLVVSALLAAFGIWLTAHFSASFHVFLQLVNVLFSLVILAGLFALMFKFLPDAKVKWRHVWIGSMVTAVLFHFGKWALGLYFGKASPGIGYGAAGSVILILLWVSYTSMIVFFGAEFTRAYADKFSGEVKPTAVAVVDKEAEEQRAQKVD